jgi:hypothetical protein
MPQQYGQHVPMLAVLGTKGFKTVMTVEDSTAAEVFRKSGRRVRGPTLRPGDMLVMANLRGHKAFGVQ